MIHCRSPITKFITRVSLPRRMPTSWTSSLTTSCRSAVPLRSYSKCSQSMVKITYIEADGTEKIVDATVGKNLMDVAHEHHVELEGACGGELACSTCHLIFEEHIFETLPEKAEEEDDMLDLAFEVTPTSRLGCQILVREDMEGMTVRIPDDGF